MKSTYKIFGIVWNNLEDKANFSINTVVSKNDCILNAKDTIISFKRLLSIESDVELTSLVTSIRDLNKIYIDVDYWTSNNIIEKFLNKRLSQIATYLSKTNKEVVIFR